MNEERLIELVRNHPYLYDTSNMYYRDVHKKEETWEEIAGTMGIQVTLAKKKWRCLRDRYMRSKKLIKGTTGQATIKVQAIAALEFLEPFIQPRSTNSNVLAPLPSPSGSTERTFSLQPSSSPVDHGYSQPLSSGSAELPSSQPPSFDPAELPSSQPPSSGLAELPSSQPSSTNNNPRLQPRPGTSRRQNRSQQATRNPISELVEFLQTRNEPDGTDMMFLGFSNCVKTLTPRNQMRIKSKIMQIIAEVTEEEANENSANSQ
ncbi:uncharacterized protein LOC126581716 [Anopheles aquasalis]|uniref:uncharacterized protein LOC126581716 n=1 Tax=Anopheles aquasalis TaxID=42839 RepID=UPI00215A4A38|nr:uncharacterized protein LOC126581716 [Anopheles aquasalis]